MWVWHSWRLGKNVIILSCGSYSWQGDRLDFCVVITSPWGDSPREEAKQALQNDKWDASALWGSQRAWECSGLRAFSFPLFGSGCPASDSVRKVPGSLLSSFFNSSTRSLTSRPLYCTLCLDYCSGCLLKPLAWLTFLLPPIQLWIPSGPASQALPAPCVTQSPNVLLFLPL